MKRAIMVICLLVICIGVLQLDAFALTVNVGVEGSVENVAPASDTTMTYSQLRAYYAHGKYWNHYVNTIEDCGDYLFDVYGVYGWLSMNDPERNRFGGSVTNQPCYAHYELALEGFVGHYDCNYFDGAVQCMGFARRLGYEYYGSYVSSWQNAYYQNYTSDMGIKPGDVVEFRGNGVAEGGSHTVFVIGVSGSVITVGECNFQDNPCMIKWDGTYDLAYNNTITVWRAPWEMNTNIITDTDLIEWVYFDYEQGYGVKSCDSSIEGELIIPETYNGKPVIGISYRAFENCSNLTSINIPDGVTYIGAYAFNGCSSLKSVNIPDSVTSIDYFTFYGCSSLTTVTMSNRVQGIRDGAFGLCDALQTVYYEGTPKQKSQMTIEGGNECLTDATWEYNILRFALNEDGESYAVVDWLMVEDSDVIVPATYKGKPVTKIEEFAFDLTTYLKSITIPDSVTTISECAFYKCFGLETIILGDGVTDIEDFAFYECSKLTHITLGNSVRSIGFNAFYGCSSLESVTIGEGVTSIGDWAFAGCDSLESITIPDGVTSIGDGAFAGCSSLTSITIPDSVTSIGKDVFKGCNNLVSITIPYVGGGQATAQAPHQYPFGYIFGTENYTGGVLTNQGHYDLKTNGRTYLGYYIPSSLKYVKVTGTEIPNCAFENCSGLTEIVLTDGITEISKYAFDGCGLTSMVIPDSVTKIDDSAFYNCYWMQSITIPDSVTTIGASAFAYCNNLEKVYYSGSNEQRGQMDIDTYANEPLENATWVYAGAAEPEVPECLEFALNGNNKSYSVISCGKEYVGDLKIPTTYNNKAVTSIGAYAFSDCSSLTSIIIPDCIESIGNYAFSGCSSLISVTIPSGVTSIGDSAFQNCSSLECIWVDTENSAYCSDQYGVLYTKDMTTLMQAPGALAGEYEIYDGVTSIGAGAFSGCSSLESVIIPDSVSSIRQDAFYGCTSLTNISIPHGVTNIAEGTFGNCDNLKSIRIPNSVTNIKGWAFSGCDNLQTVYYSGTKTESQKITYNVIGNMCLWEANWVCSGEEEPEEPEVLPGDVNGDGEVTAADAVYLLYHTFVPSMYPVSQDCDYNGDGEVTAADAVYLLYHTFVPDLYPIN